MKEGNRPRTLPEYLAECCGLDFHELLTEYGLRRPAPLREALGCAEGTPIRHVGTRLLRTESVLEQPEEELAADLVLRGDYLAAEEGGERRCSAEFRFRCVLDLTEGGAGFRRLYAAPQALIPEDAVTRQAGTATDRWLLPLLRREDYPRMAERMLRAYYPEALRGTRPVNAFTLARRMGLRVYRARLEPGSRVQGRVFFAPAAVSVRDPDGHLTETAVEAGTVLLNRDLCPDRETEAATLVHECVHYCLDRHFFRLQQLCAEEYPGWCSRELGAAGTAGNRPADWMERHAERLPAYILLPEARVRQEAERVLARFGGERTPEAMRRLIVDLAGRFGVPRPMVKLRLLQLGYPEAAGVMARTDGREVPDHGCGRWKDGRTYTVSFRDAARLLREDGYFAGLLRSGRFLYAEGHFCLDGEQYLTRNAAGEPALTDYARRHMDECCLAFRNTGFRDIRADYEPGRAARKRQVSAYEHRPVLAAAPDTGARLKENADFVAQARLWAGLLEVIRGAEEFRAALQEILDRMGLTWEELSFRVGVNRKTLYGWYTRPDISLPHLVCVCVALGLRADVGFALAELAECRIRRCPNHELYLMMIASAPGLTVARCNEILRQEKLPPLHNGAPDE